MSVTITRKVELTTEECITCGTTFALPTTQRDHAYKNGGYFYCPNGHSQGWDKRNSKTETDKLRDQVSRLENAVQYEKERLEAQKRATAAAKGQLTKLTNRVGKGICPCCNRSFANLRRHISTKHPDFTEQA